MATNDNLPHRQPDDPGPNMVDPFDVGDDEWARKMRNVMLWIATWIIMAAAAALAWWHS